MGAPFFLSFFTFSLTPCNRTAFDILAPYFSLCHLICPHSLSPLSKTLFFTIPLSQAFHRGLGSWPAKERERKSLDWQRFTLNHVIMVPLIEITASLLKMQPRNHLGENDKELTEGGVHVGFYRDCMAAGLQTGATLNLNPYHWGLSASKIASLQAAVSSNWFTTVPSKLHFPPPKESAWWEKTKTSTVI